MIDGRWYALPQRYFAHSTRKTFHVYVENYKIQHKFKMKSIMVWLCFESVAREATPEDDISKVDNLENGDLTVKQS